MSGSAWCSMMWDLVRPYPYVDEPYFVSKIVDEVLTICEKIYVNTNDMLNDRELVKYLYLIEIVGLLL